MAGRRNFRVMCQMTSKRLAPRFRAASSRVRSELAQPGRDHQGHQGGDKGELPPAPPARIRAGKGARRCPRYLRNRAPRVLEKSRMEMPRITPGDDQGREHQKIEGALERGIPPARRERTRRYPTVTESRVTKKATRALTPRCSPDSCCRERCRPGWANPP